MEVPVRHRPLVLLLAVVLGQVLLLAFQIRRGHNVRLIRLWSVELLTPLERAGTFTLSKVSGAWNGYIDLRGAHSENQKLQAEVGQLELKNERLAGQAAEAVRLSRIFGFRQANADAPMVAAEVIGASADPNSETIFINRGEHDGIHNGQPVITPDGVVGRTIGVYPHTAQVLLITDKESGVGALLADTRTHGVVKGTGDPTLQMDYVVPGENVPAGDRVLTSGEDRIFPKDLPVGTVTSVKQGHLFQTIRVEPAAHLDRLEEVIVLLTERPIKLEEARSAATPSEHSPHREEKTTQAGAEPIKPSQPKASARPTTEHAAVAGSARKPSSPTGAKPLAQKNPTPPQTVAPTETEPQIKERKGNSAATPLGAAAIPAERQPAAVNPAKSSSAGRAKTEAPGRKPPGAAPPAAPAAVGQTSQAQPGDVNSLSSAPVPKGAAQGKPTPKTTLGKTSAGKPAAKKTGAPPSKPAEEKKPGDGIPHGPNQ